MRTAVRLAWRGAAMAAFGATAALAVTLGRPAPSPAALTTTVQQPARACAVAGPRVRTPAPGLAHGRCAPRPGSAVPSPAARHLQPARTRAHHHVAARQASAARPE